MKISVISLGEVKNKQSIELENEYLKRLAPIIKTNIIEISTRKLAGLSEKERKFKEAELLIGKIKKDDYLVLLDENGVSWDTPKFASVMKKHMIESTKHLVFAIGGVFGWEESVKKKAGLVLSLSPLTFTYEFARLILIEQIYRSATIIKGLPYHKN
jgi:23S rRNA (pseudouridine1915-N3)-methyltransferase